MPSRRANVATPTIIAISGEFKGSLRMARIRKVQKKKSYGFERQGFLKLVGVLILCNFGRDQCCVALSASRLGRRPHAYAGAKLPFGSVAYPPSSFSQEISRPGGPEARRTSRRSALHMVLTTPIDIIEQASTVNLLDDLIDESVRTSARRPIIRQFDPSSGWIWRRWRGTIFSETWVSCVRNMLYAFAVFLLYKSYPNIIDNHLNGFSTLWGQLLSGRLHDIGMNMATHAQRQTPEDPSVPSTYTKESRQILELMSRYVRMFNLLTYASFTRSHRPILTPVGMRRLVDRGLLTPQERESLVEANIPPTQRHSVLLMWMIRLFVEGRASGHILGGDGFEQHTLDKFHIIRAQYGAIGDELQGRMPLAYAHIVQVLVDVILWMYPAMAFSTGMSPFLVIAGTGLLTISYQGLFDLAKQFLDPYDNETYGKGEDPLSVDTLIAETNAGSVRWLYGFEEMPYNAEQLRKGELKDSLLPVRGYTVEDLAQMEEERLKKDQEMEEQRQKEEVKRAKREAEDSSKETVSSENAAGTETSADAEPHPKHEVGSFENSTTTTELGPHTVTSSGVEEKTNDKNPVHKVITVGGKVVSVKKSSDDDNIEVVGTWPISTTNGNVEVANFLAPPLEQEDMMFPADNTSEDNMTDTNIPKSEEPTVDSELSDHPPGASVKNKAGKMSDEEYNTKLASIRRAINELNESAGPEVHEPIRLLSEKRKKKAARAEEGPAEKLSDKRKKKAGKAEEGPVEKPRRMTLEDYEVEVERIISEAKEEMLETEAILSTKAGLDPLGWDYEDKELTSIADEPEESQEDLDVLEMDAEEAANEKVASHEAEGEVVPATAATTPNLDSESDRLHLEDIEKTVQVVLGHTDDDVSYESSVDSKSSMDTHESKGDNAEDVPSIL
eukprot:scaffold11680_cov142-Cylindrotheca_fusiformis.AAC.16